MAEERITNVDGAIAAKVSQLTKDAPKKASKETNRDFALHNKVFLRSCEKAHVRPTKRQASKFRRKQGLAYQHREVNHED